VIKFRYDLPLDQTMAFEAVYPEPLQLDLSEKQEISDTPGSILVWMFVGGELAGESYGTPLASAFDGVGDLTALAEEEKRTGFHCYSNTILPAFQKRGLGEILKSHWLGLVAAKGFHAVYGHARSGASQRLNAKFGAVFLEGFPDWYGTGEEYKLYRLALR
jgi:hypothetical protein